MSQALLGALVLVALGAGCKQRGTATVQLDFGEGCDPYETASGVRAYAVHGATCAGCECGGCFHLCDAATCVLGCGGGTCPIDELGDGLDLDPPIAGLHAVIFELTAVDDRGVPLLVASACAEVVLDEDGTADLEVTAHGTCCAATP